MASTNSTVVAERMQDAKLLAHFWSYVIKSDGCWLWTGGKVAGYGSFKIDGKAYSAHRISWIIRNGPMADDSLLMCHHCDNPPCVNPDHLFPGTMTDNMRDASRKGRLDTKNRGHWTHCSRGHLYSEANTRLRPDGHRICVTCVKLRNDSRYECQCNGVGLCKSCVAKRALAESWKPMSTCVPNGYGCCATHPCDYHRGTIEEYQRELVIARTALAEAAKERERLEAGYEEEKRTLASCGASAIIKSADADAEIQRLTAALADERLGREEERKVIRELADHWHVCHPDTQVPVPSFMACGDAKCQRAAAALAKGRT